MCVYNILQFSMTIDRFNSLLQVQQKAKKTWNEPLFQVKCKSVKNLFQIHTSHTWIYFHWRTDEKCVVDYSCWSIIILDVRPATIARTHMAGINGVLRNWTIKGQRVNLSEAHVDIIKIDFCHCLTILCIFLWMETSLQAQMFESCIYFIINARGNVDWIRSLNFWKRFHKISGGLFAVLISSLRTFFLSNDRVKQ